MASPFNLTAQINLRGPTNLKPIVGQIRKQLGSVNTDISLKIDNKAVKSIDGATNRLNAMNKVLVSVGNNATSLNQALRDMSSSLGTVQSASASAASGVKRTSQNVEKVAKDIKVARTEMEEFGKQAALAIRRFAAFSVVTSVVFALTNAITGAFKEFVNFDKELIRLQQVTGRGATGVKILQDEITNLATSLGVSSAALLEVTTTLAQAGLNVEATRIALKALAKTELAPSFENLTKTTEGAIAAIRQFGLEAGELEAALGSINAVSAAFAVESGDIIAAIQRTGGVFAAASKGVTEGTDALNEFIAIFTSVRQTTRESAETIATGLRTIFTRIQRSSTIQQLKQFGVELQDLEGKFVGPFEATRRLSDALNQLDPRDIRFSTIVEELGGFRQIGKVIPLIQQFATTQQALGVAQRGQSSLTDAQVKAQQSLANQIAKVREQFLGLIREVGQSTVFQGFFKIVLGLTSGLISLASAFKPILPILAVFGAIKGVSAIGQFATGFFGGLKKGGGAGGAGKNIGESISGAKEKQRAEATAKAADAIRLNTDALKSLTSAVQSLDSTIRSRGSTTLASGGRVLGFNRGGVVPGSGKGDKVPAMLEPGEVVINNKAASKYGRSNLDKMNKYAFGGSIKELISTKRDLQKYFDIEQDKDLYSLVNIKRPKDKTSFKQTREQYRQRAETIWQEASGILRDTGSLREANDYIKRKTKINPGNYDAQELDPSNTSPRRFNRIQGALAEKTTRTQTTGLKKLPNQAGADFVYTNSNGTNFVEVKNKIEATKDEDLISKALLGYAYINGKSPTYYKNNKLDNISGLNIELRSSNPLDIQKFAEGSFGGIRVPSGKGRGIKGSKGARPTIEPISTETYLKWAKGIYDEYDADPSLVMAIGPGGLKQPPEIALANKLLSEYAFETGGAGLSVGKRFVRTSKDKITNELRPYLVPDPSDPNEFGFFEDDVRKFGRSKKVAQQLSSEISQRQKTSEMQRQLFGFALEGIAKSVKDKSLTQEQLDTLSPDVLAALAADPKAQVFSLPQLKAEAAPASSTLLDSIGAPLSEFRKSGGQTNLSGVIPPEAAKQIKDAIPSYIDSIKDEPQKITKAKTALKYFDAFVSGETAEKPGHATAFVETINQILKGGIVQGLVDGGQPQPGQLVGGPFPKGRTSSQGQTWQQILERLIADKNIPYNGTSLTIGNQTVSLRSALSPSTLGASNFKKKIGENNVKTLEELRGSIVEAYASGRAEVDTADPFNLTPEEIAAARDIAIVGFRTDLKDLNPYYRKRNDIPLRVHTGILQGEDYRDVEGLWERYYNDQIATAGRIAARRGQKPTEISEDDRKTFGIANAQGYDVEVILAALGSKGGKKTANDAVDFAGGLSDLAATVFNVPANIPSQAKLTINSGTILDSIDGIIKTFAFGGQAQGPGFEEVRQQIMDKYPEIDFRISKRRKGSGFGYNLIGALKSTGGLFGSSGLNFEQPTNLKQLQEYSDKLAAKLMNPEQLAAGGLLAEPTQSTPSQTQKNFGKVALRTGNRIQATYIKEGEAATARSGQVIADNIGDGLYSVQSSSATKGYGPKLYDIVMEAATAAGGMLTSDRRTVSDAAKAVWAYYFNNRSDVKKTPLGPENWVSNSRLLDEKLYGPPDTWPPATDPAWILQTGYSKAPSDINNPDLVQKLAVGGKSNTIPAMVSNGEAFVPPQVAKKIGYDKLDRMNQADRNGMKGFAGGGISVFKGPGSGTSDSIGPIGLPQGSYVIREKATKALGLNKGGGVGVRKFGVGSPGGVFFDRSVSETIETALQLEAKRLGISVSDLAKELKKTADETRKAALAAGKTKAEANKAAREAAGQKIDLTTLYQSDFGFLEQQIQARPEKQTRVKAAERNFIYDDPGGDILETGKEQRKKKKEEYLAGQRGFTRQEAYDAGVVRPDYQASGPGRGGTSTQVKLDLQTEAILLPIRKEIAQRYAKIYDEEKKAINDFYQQKVNKALAAGEEITPIVNEAKAVLAETKAKLTSGAQAEIQTATASTTQETTAASTQRMEQLKETRVRAADPFYDAKKAADAYAAGGPGGPGGGPRVNPKMAEEQRAYFERRAEKAGMSVSGYRYSLAQQVGQQAYNIGQDQRFAKQETRDIAIGKQRELKGLGATDAAGFQKLISEGAESKEAQQAQAAIADFATNLQKIAPSMDPKEIKQAATLLAQGLATTDQSVEELIQSTPELSNIFNSTITDAEALNEAFKRVSESAGISAETLKANVSNQQIKQQAFIQSKEGQRFGALAEFAPGLTERFSKTRIGRGLGAGADFISGKGGRLSKAFAGAGGFTGIGAGIAGGAEALKQFLPKSVTSDPNTAGALGALGGAGSGAAVGAQLGSFAGPIGTLIGGVGGAIIGGIQGFFSAKNQAILTNALENVAKTTADLDQAFKKLEADSSKVNFEGAQKAFGDVLAAGQPIEDLAFAKTGFENLGSTFTGGVDKLSTGFAEGDVGKIVLGGLQTAFGASGLGFLTDYFSAPSEAQRTEAIGAMVGGASQRNESAARLAESGLQFKSTEELGKIFDNIKTGTGELNPITEQYVQGALQAAEAANGVKQLTGAQKEQITAQAKERAALDAYMKKRKESGATDEQIAKEISSNRAAAKKEGEEALKVQGELAAKQALLARATKEVAIATENLLDIYRRITAEAQRYSDELDQFSSNVNALVAGLGGDTSMREVNRTNEQVLGNVSAYSLEEVQAAANATAGLLGGTPEAQNLANQAVAQKLVQDQIPTLLRAAQTPEQQDEALNQVRDLLASQGIEGPAIETVLTDLKNQLAKGEGLTESELQDQISKSFSTVGKGLEALQAVTKKYNDTLQQARKFQADYNKAILEAGSYLRKATQVRLNAELDLAKALGRSPTLQELNKPFDVEIASLTGGLVESGDLAAGAAQDPMAIAAAISSAERRKQEIEKTGPELTGAAANLPAGPAGDPLRQQLNQAQLENIQAIGDLTVASAEGRQALEKLANDGTKAANALSKIQEQQQAIEGFGDFAQKVFTAEPQQLAEMEMQAVALNAAQVSGPEFFKSRFNRQQAFAGLEQERGFMTRDEYNQTRASLIRKSFEAQGFQGGDVVKTIAGKDITLDELEKRLAGGIDETDPNVIAFREATEIQAKANEALGQLNKEQAVLIQEAMKGLEFFLTNEFPDILTNAVTKAREDAETKPEVRPKEEPRKPSLAEQAVTRGEEKVKAGREKLDKLRDEEAGLAWYQRDSATVGRINQQRRRAQEQIAMGESMIAANKPKAEAEAAARAQQETAAAEAKKQAEAEAKARDQEQRAKQSQDAIDRAIKSREGDRPDMVRNGQRIAAGAVARPQKFAGFEQVRQQIADEDTRRLRDAGFREEGLKQKTDTEVKTATEGVQTSVAQLQSPLDLVAQMATAALQSGSIYTHDVGLQEGLKVLTKVVSSVGDLAASGLIVNDVQVLEALNNLQGPFAVLEQMATAALSEGINTKDTNLAGIIGQVKPAIDMASAGVSSLLAPIQAITTTLSPLLDAIAAPIKGIASYFGVEMSTNQALGAAGGLVTAGPVGAVAGYAAGSAVDSLSQPKPETTPTPNRLELANANAANRVVSAPVPVTMPPQASFTNQQTTTPPTTATATEGQLLTIDPNSIEKLNTFNTNFASYVDRLVTFEFPTIPDVIEMKGNHVVDVRISGAAAFEGLKKDFESMMQKEIKKAMGKIWGQSGGQMGDRPDGTAP